MFRDRAYDAAGDALNDTNSGYEYDAEGRRALKVLVSGEGTPQATTTVENEYLLGLDGEQVSVLNGNSESELAAEGPAHNSPVLQPQIPGKMQA